MFDVLTKYLLQSRHTGIMEVKQFSHFWGKNLTISFYKSLSAAEICTC
jgi:hypothetical protein